MAGTAGSSVVVGVDGSASALRAVRWAAEEAVRRGLGLRLVHVHQAPVDLPGGVVEPYVIADACRDQGKRWLDEARAVAVGVSPRLRMDAVLEIAPVVPVLVKESLTAAVLVLGGTLGLLVGSTAVLLAGRAHCPMVAVHGDEDGPAACAPVVVGVDGLPKCDAVIDFAFAEASLLGADLVAVHAWTDSLTDAFLHVRPERRDVERGRQRGHETLAARLAGWQEKYPDVHVTREVRHDHPSRALLEYAKGARLIVVGTRGRGGFTGLLLGSTGQHLLHHASCPVAIVPAESGT